MRRNSLIQRIGSKGFPTEDKKEEDDSEAPAKRGPPTKRGQSTGQSTILDRKPWLASAWSSEVKIAHSHHLPDRSLSGKRL
jgi:hypothetical protein